MGNKGSVVHETPYGFFSLLKRRNSSLFPDFDCVVLQSWSSVLVRCLIAEKHWRSISPIAGKYVKPSKALWFTGFNNPGDTNPISEQAHVGFQGWELGADKNTAE